MNEIDESVLRGIAERIILSRVEDYDYLGVTEMTDEALSDDPTWQNMTIEEQDATFHQVDAWLSKADVNIVFRED